MIPVAVNSLHLSLPTYYLKDLICDWRRKNISLTFRFAGRFIINILLTESYNKQPIPKLQILIFHEFFNHFLFLMEKQ